MRQPTGLKKAVAASLMAPFSSSEENAMLDVDFNSTIGDNVFMDLNARFGDRLKKLRRERGFTLRALAEKINVDFSYLSKIENARLPHTPSVETIRALASALDADPIELLQMAEKLPPELGSVTTAPAARRFMQRATEVASPEDWEALLKLLEKRHSKPRAKRDEGGVS
jgi:transcriptional regulator with XRE-family HTH domain